MLRKLRLFMVGLIPGLLIVFFILNQKGVSCSGYLPESRVIAETLSKPFSYSPEFTQQMKQHQVTEQFLKDSIIQEGGIDFNKSHAQAQPCPDYYLFYPKRSARYEVTFVKCRDQVTFSSLKKIQ